MTSYRTNPPLFRCGKCGHEFDGDIGLPVGKVTYGCPKCGTPMSPVIDQEMLGGSPAIALTHMIAHLLIRDNPAYWGIALANITSMHLDRVRIRVSLVQDNFLDYSLTVGGLEEEATMILAAGPEIRQRYQQVIETFHTMVDFETNLYDED